MKIAMVTGASSGFGLETSLVLAERGFHVAATMRDLQKKEELLKQARARGVEGRIETLPLDVTKSTQIEAAVKAVGTVDVLVNNAGFAVGGFVEDVEMAKWRSQFETNVFGLIEMTKAVVTGMRERGSGTIIQVSSVSGRIAMPGLGAYAASKFAVEGFSEALRLEMQPYGVQVAIVEPGSYATNIWDKGIGGMAAIENSPYAEKLERLTRRVKKIVAQAGDPKEVAAKIAEIAEAEQPDFRYPLGKGTKAAIRMKAIMPWKWFEQAILKRTTE
ncbi:MAG TPA: SDR family oxidoreductase [Bacillales bacterium]|nr:SDR family oxidoreductase [Bacillales bacterium]